MGVSRDEKHSYVDGPQISFSKVYLTMNPLINETAEDSGISVTSIIQILCPSLCYQ
jgi:hypothetical protein